MNPFQIIYDKFKNWKLPSWMKPIMQALQDVLISMLKQVSLQYINYLRDKIIEAGSHTDWSNDKKFGYVADEAKKSFIEFSITLKDSELNCLIEFLVNQLKKSKAID